MSTCLTETTRFRNAAEVLTLVRGFESGKLPLAKWTHAAHLTVALWYLLRHPPAEATQLIRAGIKHYNEANGIVTTRTSGYHETLTLFWIHVVRRYLEEAAPVDVALHALANELVARCGDKHLPLEHYSRERLFSWEARADWVEPDLKRSA